MLDIEAVRNLPLDYTNFKNAKFLLLKFWLKVVVKVDSMRANMVRILDRISVINSLIS